jgi:signal transduction histidine kinase/ActR/RegA family two-component response regulator
MVKGLLALALLWFRENASAREEEIRLNGQGELLELVCRRIAGLDRPAYVKNSELRYVAVNESYARFFGREVSDFIGERSGCLLEAAEEYDRQDKERRALVFGTEEVAIRLDPGRHRAFRIQIESFAPSEERTYVFGMFMDDPAAIELVPAGGRFARQDLENVLARMPVGVLILDADYTVEYTNDALYDLWGLPKEERFEGLPLRTVVERQHGHCRGDRRSIDEICQSRIEFFETGSAPTQTELTLAGGTDVVFEFRRLSHGRLLLSYADISSLRAQEREITEARASLQRLGELMTDATRAMQQGLLIVENGRVLLSSDGLARVLSLPPCYLAQGQDARRILEYCEARGDFGADGKEQEIAWKRRATARQPISIVCRVAGERWVKVEATFSERDRWIFAFADVTEMKVREEELQRLLSRSEAANRAKCEFVANMSRVIRTPMNGALAMAERLARTNLDARQKTFIDVIVKSGNALLAIINDMLDYSEVDAGNVDLRKEPFDPVEAIEDVMTLLSSLAAEKNIELLIRASPEMPQMVVGDVRRFRQIVTNLVGNSVMFAEQGRVLVELAHNYLQGDEENLTLRVCDTGIGIPAKKLHSIFDKLSQSDTSSTRPREGTGLGLAITAGLIDCLGGSINVESDRGRGSLFTVHLPLPRVAADGRKETTPIHIQGARILVIDDDDINREILTEQLTSWGFDAAAAEDGATGLAILDAAVAMGVSVDAIILDYQLGPMSGAAVARSILEDSRFDGVSMVLLTSTDITAADAEFAALSGQAQLTKPARAKVLRNTIIETVHASRLRRRIGADARLAPPTGLFPGHASDRAHATFV